MSGYSGTPLPKKLGLAPGQRLVLHAAPPGFLDAIAPLPEGARVLARGDAIDLAVLFTERRRDLEARFAGLAARLAPAGMLWVAWPKKASGRATDLTENVVREVGLAAGLVDVKVCAIDDTWSGLRFVRRRADRPPA